MRRPLLLVVFALALASCGALEPAAAIVDGQKIEEHVLQEEVDRVRDDPSFQELVRQQGDGVRGIARRQVLGRLIRETLLDQRARQRGIVVSAAEIAAFVDQLSAEVGGGSRFRELLRQANLSAERVRELARRQLVAQALERAVTTDVSVSDEQIRAAYDSSQAQLTEYKLLKIEVGDAEAAEDVAGRARGGEDFSRLARSVSVDSSKASGGDIGWLDATALGAALAAQIDAAETGAIVGPVPAGEGFQLLKVVDRRPKPLDAVRDAIAADLLAAQRREAFERWTAQQLRRSRVVVNPKYGTFDETTLTVVASPDRLAP